MSEKNNWDYQRGHKPKGAKTNAPTPPRKPRAKAEPEEPDMVTLTVDVSEARLDQMWAKLDIGTKGAAIQHALLIEE